jgi:hypothetical protein
MTKMIIGLLAIVLGVAGSAFTSAPKRTQVKSATGYVYVKCAGDGYRKIQSTEYYPGYCDANNVVCAYVVTTYGMATVTADWYSSADIAIFADGYNAKMVFVPNGANDPYQGIYDDSVWE